jgi:dihydroorotase
MNAEVMRRALEYARHFGSYIACHEEDFNLANKGSIHEGAISAKVGLRGIPAEAETIMIARDIELARLTKSRIHICHISSRHSVELVRRGKAAGVDVTAEVTPNHLMMTDLVCEGYDTHSKVNPPLRTEEDRLALIEGLRSGVIDCVASDHAPHHRDDKFKEYDLAAFGMLGLQFIVPFTLKAGIDWVNFVKVTSSNPAKILKLTDRGQLAAGYKADIAVIDPELEYIFDDSVSRSKSKNTLHWGKPLKGMAVKVFKGGRLYN